MKNIKINDDTVLDIRKNRELLYKIQAATGVSYNTLMRWLETKDPRLTMLDILNVITEHLDKPLCEIIDTPLSKLISA